MATNYSINYDDQRFQDVEAAKQEALNNANAAYDNMVSQSDELYDKQIQAVDDYAKKQAEIQQQNTDFMIEKINQDKAKAEKDYTKEQKGAYSDYMKASNQWGAISEGLSSQGLANSGFSESSKVSMYNTYQNRISSARETYNQAVLNYDNSIKEAQLANNAQLAQIAYEALQSQLQLSLEGFQYKNTLLQTQLNMQLQIDENYYNRYKDVISQMNTENALAEQIRQYEQNLAYQKQRDKVKDQQWQKEYELSKKSLNASLSRSSGGSSGGSGGGGSNPYGNTKQSSGSGITIKTNYYNGKLPAATEKALQKYGAFSGTVDKNGNQYQPKGVVYNGKDYGSISKAGKTASKMAGGLKVYNSSGVEVSNQNVWKTSDGNYWIWNGSKMTYEPLSTVTAKGGLKIKW